MINLHDLGVNLESNNHNECIKHAQMLCKFTLNTWPTNIDSIEFDARMLHIFSFTYHHQTLECCTLPILCGASRQINYIFILNHQIM